MNPANDIIESDGAVLPKAKQSTQGRGDPEVSALWISCPEA
jgi:hypothetical protein